jgi:FkbM family methyltransferase
VSRLRTSPSLAPLLERAVSFASRPLHGRTALIRNGEAAGLLFRIGPVSTVWASGRVELPVQQVLGEILRAGDVFFDIGAHVGFFSILGGRLVGLSGTVVAFEPRAENVTELRVNVDLNRLSNVVVEPRAVSDTGGVRWLVGKHPATARLEASASQDHCTLVPVTTVDEFVDEHPQLAPQVVKIDVEGHERDVIRGMRRTMFEHGPTVICELHGTNDEVAAVLEDVAYEATLLEGSGSAKDARRGAHLVARPKGR